MGRVTRINTRQASVEIICVGETVLREPHRGIIRKEVCVASTYVYTPYITLNVSRFPLACVWSKGDYSVRVLLYPPGSWYCQNTGKPCAWCTYIYIYIYHVYVCMCTRCRFVLALEVQLGTRSDSKLDVQHAVVLAVLIRRATYDFRVLLHRATIVFVQEAH